MSLAVVVTPSTGADWPTAWEQFEGIRKSMIPLSLTNYDATTVPQVAIGSWVEHIGAIYKATANDTITGSLTSDAINYIMLTPSGEGASAILTPTWTTQAPLWSDSYQYYYWGTNRYVGGCYYDGTNYPLKWVYTNRHAGPTERNIQIPLTGPVTAGTVVSYGDRIVFTSATSDGCWVGFLFPERFIVTELKTYCQAFTAGTIQNQLYRCALDSIAESSMASCSHTGTGSVSDTSITNPVVDQAAYNYFCRMWGNDTTTGTLSSCLVIGKEIVRC